MSRRRTGGGHVIAYLTGSYARATDTFIRDEVAGLRDLGDTVVTFSVRRPADSEVINEAIAAERARTTDLLAIGAGGFALALLVTVLRHPRRFVSAAGVARQLSRPGLKGRAWPLFYLLEACALGVRLRRARVRHLHNHIAEGSASVALLASVLTGIPYSFTVHGPSEWDTPGELALDVKARHAAFIATISEYTRGQVRRWIAPEDWPKVHIVRCGVPRSPSTNPETGPEIHAETDAETAPAPERTTLLSVGRLAPAKGHRVLLESLREVAGVESLRVVIVGDGPDREPLEQFVRDNGLGAVVELAGWRTSDEVHDSLRSCTALVMPSFAEGLPVAIMEAFALGKPVISSDVGAIAELVEPGASGWLVTPGSVSQLTRALEELVAMSPAELAAYGARGREQVRAQHDIVTEVATLRALIDRSVTASR